MLLETLKENLLTAQKAQDQVNLRALRMLLSEVKNKEIELRPLNRQIEDADIVALIQKGIKSRTESIEMFTTGNRPDLVKKEQDEIAVLKNYLPQQMTQAEVEEAVVDAISKVGATDIKAMGAVMNELKSVLAGKADMAVVGALVKTKLSS